MLLLAVGHVLLHLRRGVRDWRGQHFLGRGNRRVVFLLLNGFRNVELLLDESLGRSLSSGLDALGGRDGARRVDFGLECVLKLLLGLLDSLVG